MLSQVTSTTNSVYSSVPNFVLDIYIYTYIIVFFILKVAPEKTARDQFFRVVNTA